MELSLNRILYPVTTLGYGKRVGIWVQGCSIRCPGCISRDTWENDGGRRVTSQSLMEELRPYLVQADGVTISGGEPFDQAEPLHAFLSALRGEFSGDILLFSGYEWESIGKRAPILDRLLDVVVAGPFRQSSGQTKTLRGSDNQTVHLLTALACERYPAEINDLPWDKNRKLDLFENAGGWIFAGIPKLDWGERLREHLSRQGLASRTSDQRSRRED